MIKNVLVTGGAGFVAHHVINYLLDNTDWNIISLDRFKLSGNLDRLDDIIKDNPNSNRLSIVYHDLKTEISQSTKNLIGPVDIILHLAASSHVDRSINHPMGFVMDNVVGTCNILEFARKFNNLEKFIYFSTDQVFGPASSGIDYDEYDRYNSTNPYSASKAGGEELTVAYRNTYNLPIIITHTMNVFGERQHPEKYIPMCIKKIRDGDTITIHSDASKTIPGSRHYIHAVDVADAILFILNKLPNGRDEFRIPKYNIVGKQEINNLQLAQIIADAQDKELKYIMSDFNSSRPGHDLRYSLSGQRMKNLGWEPKIELTERIKQVVDWTLNRPDWLIT